MICLDTTTIIDFLKGDKKAIDLIEKNRDRICTTEINVLETFIGIYCKKTISEKEENYAKEFFNSVEILPFKKGTGIVAAKLIAELTKAGNKIGQNDCMIASIMLKNNCFEIMTKNAKHFSRIKDLKVIEY